MVQAAQRGHEPLCRWLMTDGRAAEEVRQAGCLNRPDNDGNLPADCARLEGHQELSVWLAEKAAAVLAAAEATVTGAHPLLPCHVSTSVCMACTYLRENSIARIGW